MLTSSELRTLREIYVSSIQSQDAPSITQLCREHYGDDEAIIKQVRRASSKENWEAHRNKRRIKMNSAIERHEDAMIERIAKDLAQKREEFLKNSIKEVDDLMPLMVAELKARIESGFFDDKALVASLKLLMESREKLVAHMTRELEPTTSKTPGAGRGDGEDFSARKLLNDAGLFGRVLDVIEGAVNASHLEGGNYQEVSDHDHEVHKALTVLDAEVVGEE